MIPNNEVVDSFIVAPIITSQLLCVHIFFSHSSTKEQRHGIGILHKLKPGVLVELK